MTNKTKSKKPLISTIRGFLRFLIFLSIFNFTIQLLLDVLHLPAYYVQIFFQLLLIIKILVDLFIRKTTLDIQQLKLYFLVYLYLFIPAAFLYFFKINDIYDVYLYANLLGFGLFFVYNNLYPQMLLLFDLKIFKFVLDENNNQPAGHFKDKKLKISKMTHPNKFMIALFDDSLTTSKVNNLFDREQYYVYLINNQEDLALIHQSIASFDLIIINARTFYHQGLTIVATIKDIEQAGQIPIIFIYDDEKQQEIANQLGVNEIIHLYSNRKQLFDRIQQYRKIKQINQERLFTELMYNQSQIKPHFLFNTLSAIVSLIDDHPNQARSLLLDFSDFLRYSFDFNSTDGLIYLKDELKLVKVYVTIETTRHQAKLDVVMDVDEDINIMVPILSIQPLIENAINHGALLSKSYGLVRLIIKRHQNGILVEVFDNGPGIKQKTILEILSGSTSKGVGLVNIENRLKAYYQQGLHIESKEGEYTIVSFVIPYREKL